MKVIMLRDVGGVGRRGAVVEVKDGYALNFLIPHGTAVQATSQKLAEHARQTSAHAVEQEKAQAALKAVVEHLNGKSVTFMVRASEKGGLFRSLTAADVAKEIQAEHGAQLTEGAVILAEPMKRIGEYAATIRAGGAESRLTILVKTV